MPDFVGRFGEVGSDGVAVLSSSRQSIITSLLSAGCVLRSCIYPFELTRDTMQYVCRCDCPGLHLRPLRSPRLNPHLVRHFHHRYGHPDCDHPLDCPNHRWPLHCGSRSGCAVRYANVLSCVTGSTVELNDGLISAIVPLYNGETAPKAMRGMLLVLYQLQIIMG